MKLVMREERSETSENKYNEEEIPSAIMITSILSFGDDYYQLMAM